MKLFIQESTEQDILGQIEWYAERGFPILHDALAWRPCKPLTRSCWQPTLDYYGALSTLSLRADELGWQEVSTNFVSITLCAPNF